MLYKEAYMEILALSTTMTGILYAVAIVGGVGLIIGIALGIAGITR